MNNFCSLCPNLCAVDKNNTTGACGTNGQIKIAKYYLHQYEEPFISGAKGSGTVFFCGCSLKCVFCQNYELSRNLRGKEVSVNQLADIFRELEDLGANNVNLVSPTHYSDKIIEALNIYKPKIPVVYNTHGYENLERIKLLNKYVDVYLPDIKFFSPTLSYRYCGKKDYFDKASKAIELMAEKPYKFDDKGNLIQGTLVRHLVLPQATSDSKKILDWFVKIKDKAFINLMSQYTPFGQADKYPELNRKITKREYDSVLDYAMALDIKNALFQELKSASEEYIPSWDY